MSKSVSTPTDAAELADAVVRSPEGDASSSATAAPGPTSSPKETSRRVRELPPPPKTREGRIEVPAIEAEPSPPSGWRAYFGRRESSSFLVSLSVHLILLIVLAMQVEAARVLPTLPYLTVRTDASEPLGENALDRVEVLPLTSPGDVAVATPADFVPKVAAPNERPPGTADATLASAGNQPGPKVDWTLRSDTAMTGALDGRGREARAALSVGGDGTPQSEQAVERGLRWLMAHQRRGGSHDGGWAFDLNLSICQGQCRNSGTQASTTAATAIALLPFLGAGYTHQEGEYQDTVRRGLYYLQQRGLVTPNGVDLQDGTMYAQGLATIALCEAYAMTKDPSLKGPAQGAIDFILYAQDKQGGGWRYTPGEPGDTTVTAWQLMALKSGQMAGLTIPSPSIALVEKFLDSVQSDGGVQYGYLNPQRRDSTTPIGLLCRMYTGWGRDRPALQKGVALVADMGPSDDNMYFNYYATQLMHHWGASDWDRWNRQMREHLISTQATTGHENGSWYFGGGKGDVGGRLYNTAMAVMTLEVYYRYMPLYRPTAVEDKF